MGIRCLESYIDRELRIVLERVNIGECAKEYAERKKCDPVMLINGTSLFQCLYDTYKTEISHLRLTDKVGLHVQDLIKRYNEYNIHCVIYFEGSPIHKEQNWINQRQDDAKKHCRILSSLESGNCHNVSNDLIHLSVDAELAKMFIRSSQCEIRQFTEESDLSIMQFISSFECFGILAQDTDFIIMNGIENYFSAKYLDESGLVTKAYRRNKLASCLGFEARHLPLFASLCGNDYLSDEELRGFHWTLLSEHQKKRLRNAIRLPKSILIPKVAGWIINNSNLLGDSEVTAKNIANLIKSPRLELSFSKSFSSYSLCGRSPELEVPESDKDDWTEILHTAKLRHATKGVHRGIWTVLAFTKHFMKHAHDVITRSNANSTSQALVMEELLQRVYGVLLKECPQSLDTIIVEVYHYKKQEFSSSKFAPIFPPVHPGLKKLWGFCPVDEKLSALWWIITGNSGQSSILSIPVDVRLSTLAVYFLVNVAKYKLERWQVEALIGQVVCLSLGMDLPQYGLSTLTASERHVSAVYLSALDSIVMADDVCGNPLQIKRKVVCFSGVLLNKLFYLMEKHSDVHEVCTTPLYKLLCGFIFSP